MLRTAMRAIALAVREGTTDATEIRGLVENAIRLASPGATREQIGVAVDDAMAMYSMVVAVAERR